MVFLFSVILAQASLARLFEDKTEQLKVSAIDEMGITPSFRSGVIPVGSPVQLQIVPMLASFAWSFYFQLSSLRQAWLGLLKIKSPRLCRGTICNCGERGIRTPGPASSGTHAFQACQLNHSCISPDGISGL
jgi:hypothetical protein